ncbi:MAG: class I SAM-dependent DNA methyltransferase, partial [Bradymonadaceae bacterium]
MGTLAAGLGVRLEKPGHYVLNPEESVPLLERIDENSHKHAYSVSTDLKDGARRAIELLANEAIHYKKHVSKEAIFSRDEELAEQLTRECMTYLYRLLFLFYVEARGGELGIVPMKSDAYRKGYSLETLRDLEMVPLNSDHARNGYYISDSLDKLFEIVDRGFNTGGSRELTEQGTLGESFAVDGLRSALFDESRT